MKSRKSPFKLTTVINEAAEITEVVGRLTSMDKLPGSFILLNTVKIANRLIVLPYFI